MKNNERVEFFYTLFELKKSENGKFEIAHTFYEKFDNWDSVKIFLFNHFAKFNTDPNYFNGRNGKFRCIDHYTLNINYEEKLEDTLIKLKTIEGDYLYFYVKENMVPIDKINESINDPSKGMLFE